MTAPSEAERLNALRQLNLLDTPPTEAFDRITRMAAQLFDLPIAAVSLTDSDRQWFKSRVGVEHWSIPRHKAPCAEVAETSDALVVTDLLAHPCYENSVLADSGVRFYAGVPLITAQGHNLGAMCVLGMEPREASAKEVAVLKDLASMVMAQIELQHAFGRIDAISGLPNRIQFIEDLTDAARDSDADVQRHLILVDLIEGENVSTATRVMGPSYIDELIRAAVRQIVPAIGPQRKAYHVTATQIAFLAPRGVEAGVYVKKLTAALAGFNLSMQSRFLSAATVGVAPFELGKVEPIDVLRMAHSASQDARKLGGRVSIYSSDEDQGHKRRRMLINDFGAALQARDELRLVYQPRLDITSGECRGAEALLRWTHPILGNVSPGEFIPLVEQTSWAKGLTEWVLDEAIQQAASWRASGLNLKISINVSATNLGEADFVERLQGKLAFHGVPASALELEVTESAMMADPSRAEAALGAISALGIDLAIDDFGTGYSSLAYLQRLPANVAKIDQSFIRGLTEDPRKRELVKTMIGLCHSFGYRVVAEGVETGEALSLLAESGCNEAQGYLFAKPLEIDDFVAWLGSESHVFRRAPAVPQGLDEVGGKFGRAA